MPFEPASLFLPISCLHSPTRTFTLPHYTICMKLHILGICGTFMGGIAALARELGHTVEGSDSNVYPPMSTQLESLGIAL